MTESKNDKIEPNNYWILHLLVTTVEGSEGGIDIYLNVKEKEYKQIIKIDWKKFNHQIEGGCCGQNRCVVCANMIGFINLIDVQKGIFPFPQNGNFHREIFSLIKKYLKETKLKLKNNRALKIENNFDFDSDESNDDNDHSDNNNNNDNIKK